MADSQSALAQSIIESAVAAALRAADAAVHPAAEPVERSKPLEIVVPIFNNVALLSRCLESLLPTLSNGDTVWLIDDASDEPDVRPCLQRFSSRWPATRIIRNPRNLGFVGIANRAFALTQHDLVLLNSDTEVTRGWLERLQQCFERNPRAGVVCPLSDRATLLSVLPETASHSRADIAAAAGRWSLGDVPLPTAVGFCMLIRRRLLDEIGGFCTAFSPGYGEENDFSLRALRAGWDILAADRACVFHRSGGSFTSEARRALQAEHQARLDRIWPEYTPLVQSWWRDNPLRVKAERLAWHGDRRTGILHVLHRQYHVGGTERVVRTLIRGLGDTYRQTLVYPGNTDGAWCDLELRATQPCRELMLNKRWIRPTTRIGGHGADFTCPQSERALVRLVRGNDARLVHFHHLLHWDSLLLPAIARTLGCRVVISVHDFWFNCPIHNQLEFTSGQPCGRSHAQGDSRCTECLAAYGLHRPGRAYTTARHALLRDALMQADAVLVPSRFIRDKLYAAGLVSSGGPLLLHPHGVSRPESPAGPSPGRSRVLAYFGGDQVLKGAGLVLHLAQSLSDTGVTVRIHGRIKGFDPDTVPANVELHGFYNPDEVGQVLQGVDLALVPSFYEESFSMVASECWAHGVPVLASDRGALAERVEPGVNGWRVPDMQPESWLRAVREVLDGDTLERCRARLALRPPPAIDESVEALHRLYRELLNQPPRPRPSAGPAHPPGRFRKKLDALRKAAMVRSTTRDSGCLGVMRDHWGTAHYRIRFPLDDLFRSGVTGAGNFHVIRTDGFELGPALLECGARHVVVQPFLSDEGLRLMEFLHREVGIHVTLVVDDLWTELPPDNPARALLPDDVPGRLAYAASLSHSLVLTTAELRRSLALSHDNSHVINNALPSWIWNVHPVSPAPAGRRLRIGWAGAPQHAGDLAFLEPVIRATADLADWVFLGMCPDALRPLAAEAHPMVPFTAYPRALAELELDLAIAPLADHAFNRCKSHLKVLECGILGIPVIAADLEPYRHCPVPLAAPDDASDWTSRIRDLLQDPDARQARGRSLRQWVLDNHLTEHRRPDWSVALGVESHAA